MESRDKKQNKVSEKMRSKVVYKSMKSLQKIHKEALFLRHKMVTHPDFKVKCVQKEVKRHIKLKREVARSKDLADSERRKKVTIRLRMKIDI